MENLVFYVMNGIAEMYILFRYFGTFLGERKTSSPIVVPASMAMLVAFVALNTKNEPLLNLFASIGFMTGISQFYPESWKKKTLLILALLVLNIGLDFVLFQLFALLGHDMQANYIIHGLISILLRLIVVQAIVLKSKVREWEADRKTVAMVAIIWVVIFLYTLLFTPNLAQEEAPTFSRIVSNSVLLILSLLVFWLFEVTAKQKYSEKQAQELALQLEAQQKYYEQFERYEKEIRQQKHDLKNFLFGVLASEDSEMRDRIRKKTEEIESSGAIIYTENEVLQLLLTAKLDQIDIPGQSLEINCQIPRALGIENTDLAIIVGNLLDNAVEALEKLPVQGRLLHVDFQHYPARTSLKITNSFNMTEKRAYRRDRGIGLKSVREIVDRYEGLYEANQEGRLYTVEIILPLI